MAAPNFADRTLYHGDNLDFLRGMNSGTVHLIATDPPFNSNRIKGDRPQEYLMARLKEMAVVV
ncbi:MAG: hypothetical protein J4F46_10035 [Dehalococcoidia bacterium]|nr:hypothetical protein [Dehalococcoidia bacterium]